MSRNVVHHRTISAGHALRILGVVLAALLCAQITAADAAPIAAQTETGEESAPATEGERNKAPDSIFGAPGKESAPDGPPAARAAEKVDLSKLVPVDGSVAANGEAPVARDVKEVSKSPAKSSFDPKTSVEDVGKRGALTDAWKNADSSESTFVYDSAKYYEAAKGTWEKIDTAVVADKERPGWLRTSANEWAVSFGPLDSSGKGGIEVKGKSGSVARFSPEAQNDATTKKTGSAKQGVAPVVDANQPNKVVYREVWPGVDIVYTVVPEGLKEDIVIKKRPTGGQFSFLVDGAVLTPHADKTKAGQGVLAFSGALADEFVVAPTVIVDNSGRDVSKAAKASTRSEVAERSSAAQGAKTSRLSVGVDENWLAALPDEAFPVVIDPSVLNTGVWIWANWWADSTGTDGEQTDNLGPYFMHKIGETNGRMWRSTLRFKHEDFFASDAQTVSAIVHVSSPTSTPQIFKVNAASDGCWSWACTGTLLPQAGNVGVVIGTTGALDVTAAYVEWLQTHDDNRVLMVYSDEATTGTFKQFSATIEFQTTLRPTPVTQNPSPPNDAFIASGTTVPQVFSASTPVPQDPQGDEVRYKLQIFSNASAAGTPVYDSANFLLAGGPQLSWTVPAGTLSVGVDYWWRVVSRDQYGVLMGGALFRLRQVADRLGYDGLGGNFDGVNTLLGNYVAQDIDVHVPTVGPSIDVMRTFNTASERPGISAKAAWGNAFSRLYGYAYISGDPADRTARFEAGDGRVTEFMKTSADSSNAWVSPPGTADVLTGPLLGPWTLTRGDGTQFSFVAAGGDVTQMADASGHVVTIDRTTPGLTKVRDIASGREVRYSWTVPGLPTAVAVEDPAGGTFTWTYEYTVGNLTKACDPLLACKSYIYQTVGGVSRLTEILDRNNKRDVLLSYTPNGRVQSVTDAYGNTTTFAYFQDPASLQFLTTITDADQKVWLHRYSAAGDLIGEQAPVAGTPAAVGETTYTVDPATRQRTAILDALGHTSYLSYDTNGRVIAQKNAAGEKTLTVYDDAGNKAKECDGRTPDANNDNVPDADTFCVLSDYGSDTATRKQRLIRSRSTPTSGGNRSTETWTYTTGSEAAYPGPGSAPPRMLRTHTDALGMVTTIDYNASGDVTRTAERTGGGFSVRIEAEAATATNLTTQTPSPLSGASGNNGRFYSGGWSNYLTFTVSPTTGGSHNVVLRYAAPSGLAHRKLEVNGVLVANAFTLPGTGWGWSTITIPVELNAGSNSLTFTTDAATGSDNEVYYDVIDVASAGTTGATIDYGYDSLGRVTSKSVSADAWTAPAATTYTYDAVNQKKTETGPAVVNPITGQSHQGRTTWVYDPNRNTKSEKVEDLLGGDAARETKMDYDNMDRVVTVTDPELGATMRRYDKFGRVAFARDANGAWLKTTYDARHRPTSVTMLGIVAEASLATATGTEVSSTEYDAAGRKFKETDAENRVVQYGYDLADRLTSSTLLAYPATAPVTPTVELSRVTYDAAGRPKDISEGYVNPQSNNAWPVVRSTHNDYDEGGRVAWTTVGQAQAVSGSGASSMRNDFTYDVSGNVTKKVTTQLTPATPSGAQAVAEQRFEYFANGKVARQIVENGPTDLVTSYTYNSLGWTTSVVPPEGNAPGANPYRFRTTTAYDRLGRAIETRSPVVTVETSTVAPSASQPTVTAGYNTFSDVTHERDANGNITVTSYDRLARKKRVDSPAYTPVGGTAISAFETYEYDAVGNLKAHADRLGCTTKYDFDAYNRVTTQTDPSASASCGSFVAGGVWAYTYDKVGNKTKVVDPTGAITEYTYDAMNHLRTQKQTVPAVTVTPAAGMPGPTAAQTIPATTVTTGFGCDNLGRLRSTYSQEGVESRTEYDVMGQVTKTASMGDPATAADDLVTVIKRDVYSNPVVTIDPSLRETRNEYDLAGRSIATGLYLNAAATTPEWKTRQALDANGRVVTSWPAEAVKANAANPTFGYRYGYDAGGRLVSVSQPLSAGRTATTTYGYDAAGNATRVTSPTGLGGATPVNETFTAASGTAWNSTNWTAVPSSTPGGVIEVNNNEGRFKYANTAGSMHADAKNASHTDATLTAKVRFDAPASDQIWSFVWLRASATSSTSSPWAPSTGYGFGFSPAYGGLLYLQKASGGTTSALAPDQYASINVNQTYNVKLEAVGGTVRAKIWADGSSEPGWMMTGTDASPLPAGTASLYTNTWASATRDVVYDNVTVTTPGSGSTATTSMTYTSWNQLQDTIEPATPAFPNAVDRTFTLRYDAAGQVVSQTQPGGVTIASTYDKLGRLLTQSSGGASRTFTYDLVGRTKTISLPSGVETFVYDARGLVVGSTGAAGNTIATYDGDGRVLTRNDPAGLHTFTWNKLNQLKTAVDPLSAVTVGYGYNAAGQLTSAKYGTAANAPLRTYAYNNAGWLASDTFKNTAGTATMSASYQYDANGNVKQEVLALPGNSAAGTYDYGFDQSDRLVSFARSGAATVLYTFDDAGNRTSANPVGGAAQVWSYDARNRLQAGPEGNYVYDARGMLDKVTSGGSTSYDASFDGLGRLTSAVSGGVTNTFTYDALDRVAKRGATVFVYAGASLDPSSVGTVKYSRSPAGRLLGIKTGTAAAVSAGLNRHGDLRWTFTAASGATSATNVMDPFGKPIVKTGSTNGNVGFQGDYTDPTTGDVWMGARWYTPGNASFRSRDTYSGRLENPISLNRYTYGFANPLRFFDPDGRCPDCGDLAMQLWDGLDMDQTASETTSSTPYRNFVSAVERRARESWSLAAAELQKNDPDADTSGCGADDQCRANMLLDRLAALATESGAAMTSADRADALVSSLGAERRAVLREQARMLMPATEAACMASWFSNIDRAESPFVAERGCRQAAMSGKYRPADFFYTSDGMANYQHVFLAWASAMPDELRKQWDDANGWAAAGETFAAVGGMNESIRLTRPAPAGRTSGTSIHADEQPVLPREPRPASQSPRGINSDGGVGDVEYGPARPGSPKPSPNFVAPTNSPQLPPAQVRPGNSIREMAPTEQYPNGYWVETNASGQPINPSTGKPPSNVSKAEARAQTHVPLPPS